MTRSECRIYGAPALSFCPRCASTAIAMARSKFGTGSQAGWFRISLSSSLCNLVPQGFDPLLSPLESIVLAGKHTPLATRAVNEDICLHSPDRIGQLVGNGAPRFVRIHIDAFRRIAQLSA